MISYQTNQAPSSIRPRSPSSVDRYTTPVLNESMNTYIARAQELLSDCIECLMASNASNKESAIQTLNDDITNGFVHGTLEKYLKLITTKNFPDFTTACTEARRAEEELAEFPQLDHSAAIKRDCFLLQNTNNSKDNKIITDNNEKIKCTFCQKPGHTIDLCYKRKALENNQKTANQQNSNTINSNNFNIQICGYCQKPGHTIDICFKRKDQTNNQNFTPQQHSNLTNPYNSNMQTCNYCQKPGDTNDVCFKRKAHENNQNSIYQQNPNTANFNNSDNRTCKFCKKPGHLIKDCRKRIYNNNIQNTNGFANSNNQQHPGNVSAPRLSGATTGVNYSAPTQTHANTQPNTQEKTPKNQTY
ncbi:hypothetical protein PV328_012176 [Microctonus aethiopoides]|uniref:CCHC-type domain-containing protein n=1 Tax=Microctonus aethiopoides TaxID=144406 RepID=A0AA39C2N7_9HYME|nr:hypothetical protein PV328_012176 [Microctonus aethiopoides]